MFVDASALTAMLADEADGFELMARMRQAKVRVTSPVAVWEAAVAVARLTGKSIKDAATGLDRFLELTSIQMLPIPREAASARADIRRNSTWAIVSPMHAPGTSANR
jgi:ribonuclease VapC